LAKKSIRFFNSITLLLTFFIFIVIFIFYQVFEVHQRKVFLQKEFQSEYNIPKSQYKISANPTYADYGYIIMFKDEPEVTYFFEVLSKEKKYLLYFSSYRFKDSQDSTSSKVPKRLNTFEKINEKLE